MTPEQLMQIYLGECMVHSAILEENLAEIRNELTVNASTLQNLSKTQIRLLDQLAYRFTKLQDTLGQKVLPLILELAQEPILTDATFSEKLNYLERMGALPSAEEWKKLRIARNAVAHEYPDDPEFRVSAFQHFFEGVAQLNVLFLSVSRYVTIHFPHITQPAKHPPSC
jgi:dihydroorotase-like cyclic amidohydrolase